jgi:hypothetical protein
MKKLLLAGIIAVSFAACKNNAGMSSLDVPAEVVASFNQRYPNASNVDWDTSNGQYEAEFRDANGNKQDVYYRPDGTLIRVDNNRM